MTMDVRGPNGMLIRFPDGTDAATIDRVMREATTPPPATPPQVGGATPAAAAPASPPQAAPEPGSGLWDMLAPIAMLANPIGLAGYAATPGAAQGPLGQAAQGATFGTMDEMAGAAGGLVKAAQGGTFSEGYDQTTQRVRGDIDKYREAHPIAAGVSEVAGALATLPVTGPLNAFRVPQVARAGAPLATKVGNALARTGAKTGNAAVTGGVYGGAYGAGTSEGGPGARLEGMLEGGAIGAGLGVAAPAVVGGVMAGGRALFGSPIKALQHAARPNAAADRLVGDAVQSDAALAGLSVDQSIARMEGRQNAGLPVTALDMGESTRNLGRTARNISPEAHDILATHTSERVATQFDRLADFLSRPGIAPGVNAPQKLRVLQDAAKRSNDARYKRAYFDGARGIWNQELAELTASPAIQKAIRNAVERGKSEAALSRQGNIKMPFVEGPNGTLVPAPGVTPTLEFWDQVQRSLRDLGKNQSGERMAENAALYDRLRGRLNSVLDTAVPSFSDARLGAFKFFAAEDALEAGVKFANMRGDVLKSGAAREAIEAMTPAERALFAEGYASEFLNKSAKIPIDHSMIKRIFNDRVSREQFELALGPQATREMEARMHIEGIMDKGRAAIVGNSTSAAQIIATQTALFGGRALVGGIGGAALSGDPMSVGTLLGAALTAGIGRRAALAMSRADQQMMRRVAEMLASDDPAVVKEAIQRISQNPRMMENLRAGHAWATRTLLPLSGQGHPPVPALVDTGTGSQPAQADN